MSYKLRNFFNRINTKNNDIQYLRLISNVLENGEFRKSRNGNVITSFGEKMEFSLNNYSVPVITTKNLAWKTCLKELLWFISGETSNEILKQQNVKIWNPNSELSFKEENNIYYEDPNDLGPIYGHQWRHFNARYHGCNKSYKNEGIDQLNYIIDSLLDNEKKYSRRLVMSAWNPCQLDEMVLPPCHILSHFHVIDNRLSCAIYQRSGDVGLGVPFNIASYGFLTCLLAKHCNLEPNKLVHFIGDAHIYENHIEPLKEQLKASINDSPTVEINKKDNIDDYILKDFKLKNYKKGKNIVMEMIA
tara:strand:+ start:2832 stop:3740 length:909 start_codon:yes stop_codon:yes gene_type:complete